MIGGAVIAWAVVMLFLISGQGWWMPIITIIGAIIFYFLGEMAAGGLECYFMNKRIEINQKRKKRGKKFKHTFKTRWVDFWQDIIFDIKDYPWQ